MNILLSISTTIRPVPSLWHVDYCAKNFRNQSSEQIGGFE